MLGIPEISLTEKMDPAARLFVILKSCPAEPSKDNVPEFKVSYGVISIALPIPRVPVEGLYCSLLLVILRLVEIPDVLVTNPR
jgi:hypothetical protein